jgi:acyl-CoA dehydrogenase
MIDFELDQEQQMLAGAIGRFAGDRVRKVFRDADEEGKIPAEVLRAGWEIGLLPSSIPEQYGGFGDHSTVTGAIALEGFAWGDLATALSIFTPANVALPVLLAGSENQKESILPRFSEEAPPNVTAALTEPRIQFDPRALQTTAVRQEDNSYILNGAKSMVPLAKDAELFLVYAAEDGRTQAFIVPADSEGLAVTEREKLMGIRALATFGLTLDDCRVAAENKLGGEAGIDFDLLLNHSRVAVAAAAVGMARAAYEYSLDYAKNRVQFDEPIAHRQSIAFMLADMAIDVDAARLMVWESAWLLDQGKDATQATAALKYYTDEMALRVADQAVQILGGYGYIREYPAELWLRNARGLAAFDGLVMV